MSSILTMPRPVAPGLKPRFRLLRYFSIVNAIAAVALGALSVGAYITHQTRDLLVTGEEQNISFATMLSNVIWSDFGDYLSSTGNLGRDELLARPETRAIADKLRHSSHALPILKVKLFHPSGLTTFSSDFSQIGEDKSTNVGFLKASRQGQPASKTSFRGAFSSFEDVRVNVHLVETYVPIKDQKGNVVSVFELYTDITPRVESMEREIWIAAFAAVVACIAFYSILYWIVLRADRAIAAQDGAIRASHVDLDIAKMRLDSALKNLSHGVSMFDNAGRLTLWNDRFAELYGLNQSELSVGLDASALMKLRDIAGSAVASSDGSIDEPAAEQPSDATDNDITVQLADGRHMSITTRHLPDGGSIRVHEDITGRKKSEERIRRLAMNDELTGLMNRTAFIEALQGCVDVPTAGGFCLLLIDLDGFKGVNDTLGHATGDALLTGVAQRLKGCLRKSDYVARLGGDEFALIIPSIDGPDDAADVASRIVDCLSVPFESAGHTVTIGASIGIAVADTDGDTASELLRKADAALYRAKAEGRNTFRFYAAGMDEALLKRQALEMDLRKAVEKQAFELHYQPIVSLTNRRIVSFEALIRWRHPNAGLISPAEFIPVADETGLIKKIGAWALKRACRDAAQWPDDVSVSVNLSAVQFDDGNILSLIDDALHASGLPASRLIIELTESAIIRNFHQAMEQLRELKSRGVTIAMDDFGTGYSSLSHLRQIAFDKIKIDRSFVTNVDSNDASRSIVRAIVELGRALGLPATAEGVETAEEMQCLMVEGCAEAQGYYFSKPVPNQNVLDLIEAHHGSGQAAA